MTTPPTAARSATRGVRGRLREDVLAAIEWVLPEADEVDVALEGGVVRLSGSTASIEDRDRVVAAAQTVSGVQVVVDDLEVRALRGEDSTDGVLAAAVLEVLQHLPSIQADDVRCRVRHALVALTGSVAWRFERDTIVNLVAAVPGVRDLVDAIRVQH